MTATDNEATEKHLIAISTPQSWQPNCKSRTTPLNNDRNCAKTVKSPKNQVVACIIEVYHNLIDPFIVF